VTAQGWIAGMVGVAAIADDLTRRRISNWIPACAFASGLILQIAESGWRGAVSALLGTAAGAGIFLIFYLLGGMGGGDVKLMAGFGAVLGVPRLLEASLWTAGCGGVMAVLVMAASSLRGLWVSKRPARNADADSATSGAPKRGRVECIPYAPAIAAGVWLSLVPKT
jgi:prepilin peptidase CpaA